MTDEVSLLRAEIRHLGNAVGDLNGNISRLNDKMDRDFVRKDVYETQKRDIDKDIESLNNSRTWVVSIMLGLVVAAMVGSVLIR